MRRSRIREHPKPMCRVFHGVIFDMDTPERGNRPREQIARVIQRNDPGVLTFLRSIRKRLQILAPGLSPIQQMRRDVSLARSVEARQLQQPQLIRKEDHKRSALQYLVEIGFSLLCRGRLLGQINIIQRGEGQVTPQAMRNKDELLIGSRLFWVSSRTSRHI